MTWKPHQRNNFLAGVFLIGSLILAVVVSVILSGNPFARTTTYKARFTLSDGATGLGNGSRVLVGGHQVGSVSRVELDLRDGNPDNDGVVVFFDIERGVELRNDAWVTLEKPLLGSLSTINIPSIGTGTPADTETLLVGSIAPPSFLRDAGWRREETSKLQAMVDRFDKASARALDVVNTVDPERVDGALRDVEDSLREIRQVVADVTERIPGWTGNVDQTLENAREFSGMLPGIGENADAGIGEGRALVASVQDAVTDNRGKFDDIVDDAHETADRVNEEWGPLGTETLTSARDTMNDVQARVEQIGELVAEYTPEIRKMMANGRLASDQLKLAILEIRAQPWRLLVKPNTREFESQVLYDAARTYALATSDLRAAGDALARVQAFGGGEGERAEELLRELDGAFEKYKAAEAQLLERMIETGP